MLCNDYPITKDLSQGTLKRAYVIPFRHEFMEGVDRDSTLFDRIIKNEMAGILNRAIEGLQRLMVRGHFLEPADCLVAKAEFLNASNPLPQFIASGWCIMTVQEEIANVTADATLALQTAINTGNRVMAERLEKEIAVAAAKAEKAGTEGISQTTQEFYNNFILYCRNEGNEWKPKKSAVERDLVHLKYPVAMKNGQLHVFRLRSLKVVEQTPARPM
jgi:phage/plasmid-associated DNA primase